MKAGRACLVMGLPRDPDRGQGPEAALNRVERGCGEDRAGAFHAGMLQIHQLRFIRMEVVRRSSGPMGRLRPFLQDDGSRLYGIRHVGIQAALR